MNLSAIAVSIAASLVSVFPVSTSAVEFRFPADIPDPPIFRSGFEHVPMFFVSAAAGSDSNPGTRDLPWRTIGHAVSASTAVPANSIIHVAAGTYAGNIDVERSDITLVGYRTTPGDAPPVLANATINPGNGAPTFPNFDPAQMPLIDGTSRSSGYGIDLRGSSRVTLRNLNIREFAYGVLAGTPSRTVVEGHVFDNVNVSTIGDTSAGYSGMAYALGSISTSFANGNVVRNALIINAAAEGLKINGDDNLAHNVRVYSTEGDTVEASTDYYVIVSGKRNRVAHSYIWRKPDSAHSGHGYTLKDNADQLSGGPLIEVTDNLLEHNVAVNMGGGYVVRHRGVKNNRFVDNVAYGNHDGQGNCGNGSGITIRDGAQSNVFVDTRIVDTCRGIVFGDSVEDGGATGTPPMNNQIIRARVENSYFGVLFHRDNANEPLSDAGSNEIRDSDFVLTRYLFRADRPATGMRYFDTRFSGTASVAPGYFRAGTYATDIVRSQFTNCTFDNIAGGLPAGW